MIIANTDYSILDISSTLTVPDCFVLAPNKLGTGHGEGKFYFGSKTELNDFFDSSVINCFALKSDFLTYLETAKKEYKNPTQNYLKKSDLPNLWEKHLKNIMKLEDVISFEVSIQDQIAGPRGYLNSNDPGFRIFRELSLPLISYISIMKLQQNKQQTFYYWKLFVDYEALQQRGMTPLVFKYGDRASISSQESTTESEKETEKEKKCSSNSRNADKQAKYRQKLLESCPFCPITLITDERLLVASHIKPYSVSTDQEAFDPKNGFILSPLYDRLFDQGYLSFDKNKKMMVSNWISPINQKKCDMSQGKFVQQLPLDPDREHYLEYHRKYVFKG